MCEVQAAVKLEYRDGRLCAVRVKERDARAHDEAVDRVSAVFDTVLERWAKHRPSGYAVPCFEEALRDTIHDTYRHPDRRDDEDTSFAPFGRVFVRSTPWAERSGFRILQPSALLEQGLIHGNPYSFYYRRTRQEIENFLSDMGGSFEVIRPISTEELPGTPWVQIDGGTPHRCVDSPFRGLARFQFDTLARSEPKRAMFADGELLILDGPSALRYGLLSLHDAFAEVTMPTLRFESLLRVMDILGVTHEEILAYASSHSPLDLQFGDHLRTLKKANQPLEGRLAWGRRRERFGFFLGSPTELEERHTFHTLWEKYGLPGMTLETYLKLRRPQG